MKSVGNEKGEKEGNGERKGGRELGLEIGIRKWKIFKTLIPSLHQLEFRIPFFFLPIKGKSKKCE